MSVLTGPEIERLVLNGTLVIEPFNRDQVSPASYNCALADTLVLYDKGKRWHDELTRRYRLRTGNDAIPFGLRSLFSSPMYDPSELDPLAVDEEELTEELVIPPEGLVLWPGVLYLGSTVEYTETPHQYLPCIDGRSSLGRLGVACHCTAGRGDPCFKGTFTLELSVVQPVRLRLPLVGVQISYARVEGGRLDYSSAKYQGQRKPRPSGLWKEFLR